MMRVICSGLATLLVVICGVVHGYWTDRWTPTAVVVAEAAARFPAIPMEFGNWSGQPVDRKPGRGEELFVGNMQRCYTNTETGETVMMALVCGRPGPISIHTPDICYGGNGFEIGPSSRVAVPGTSAEFWSMDASRSRAGEETRLRVYWGWCPGDGWSAPEDPRVVFARHPVLHKLYVVRELVNVGEPTREDPCLGFLRQLLPELERTLFRAGQ